MGDVRCCQGDVQCFSWDALCQGNSSSCYYVHAEARQARPYFKTAAFGFRGRLDVPETLVPRANHSIYYVGTWTLRLWLAAPGSCQT